MKTGVGFIKSPVTTVAVLVVERLMETVGRGRESRERYPHDQRREACS